MSIRIMTAVWEIPLPDSEKLTLLALADCANDEGTCWPSMATLARKCSKSDRTVQKAIQSLCDKGHLTRSERPGKGVLYQIHPRSDDTPERASPPKGTTKTPEAASDKPSRTINTPQTPQGDHHDEGDRYWAPAPGRSWAEAGPMLRKLESKASQRSRAKRQSRPANASYPPAKPKCPVAAKVKETPSSAIMHSALRGTLGGTAYDKWFAHTAMIHDAPGATVYVSSHFQQSWIEEHFASQLLSAAQSAFGGNVRWVRVQVEQHA